MANAIGLEAYFRLHDLSKSDRKVVMCKPYIPSVHNGSKMLVAYAWSAHNIRFSVVKAEEVLDPRFEVSARFIDDGIREDFSIYLKLRKRYRLIYGSRQPTVESKVSEPKQNRQ